MIREAGLPEPADAFVFDPENPDHLVADVLREREELGLPLARYFPPFRQPVVETIINGVSKENALFAIATALPNIAPGLIELPWAVAEISSDTAFLTVNQIRMLFLLAGASDRPLGYREQRAEIASLIAGAFGWRALARELAGRFRSAPVWCPRRRWPSRAPMWWGGRRSGCTESATATHARSDAWFTVKPSNGEKSTPERSSTGASEIRIPLRKGKRAGSRSRPRHCDIMASSIEGRLRS